MILVSRHPGRLESEHVEHLRLNPFGPEQIAEFLARRLGPERAELFLRRFGLPEAGNPRTLARIVDAAGRSL